jgi:putative endonuclease
VTNYSHGHDAEKIAAEYLKTHGYTVLELNWRHVRAEIDIVAQKRSLLHLCKQPVVFFEVKYRKTSAQGNGLDYITSKKLHQMQFAAELWVATHNHKGEYALGAIEVSGSEYEVTALLENGTLFFIEKCSDTREVTSKPVDTSGDFFATKLNIAFQKWLVEFTDK